MKNFLNNIWQNRSCRIGLILFGFVIFISFVLPQLFHQDPNLQNLDAVFRPSSANHLLGTDNLGRDNFLRIINGAKLSMVISLSASTLAIILSIFIGVISSIFWYKTQWFFARIIDLFMAFPKYFILIFLLGFSDFGIGKTILVMATFSWMEVAKLIRSEIQQATATLYYKAAVCQGLSKIKLFYYHLLPGLIGIIISSFSLLTGSMISLESGLSFVGLGVQPPFVSLGNILNQARYNPEQNFILLFATGVVLILIVTSFNLIGDGVKDIFHKEKFQK